MGRWWKGPKIECSISAFQSRLSSIPPLGKRENTGLLQSQQHGPVLFRVTMCDLALVPQDWGGFPGGHTTVPLKLKATMGFQFQTCGFLDPSLIHGLRLKVEGEGVGWQPCQVGPDPELGPLRAVQHQIFRAWGFARHPTCS